MLEKILQQSKCAVVNNFLCLSIVTCDNITNGTQRWCLDETGNYRQNYTFTLKVHFRLKANFH